MAPHSNDTDITQVLRSRPSKVIVGASDFDEWLYEVSGHIRGATLANLDVTNSCIFTTRIACEVLSRVGLSVRAQPVWVTVFNREAKALADRGIAPNQWPDSAWSLGTNELGGTTEAGWNGHLVVVLRRPGQPRVLLDITADQFHRPDREIVLDQPVLLDIPSGTPWTPQDPANATLPETGVAIMYRPMAPGHMASRTWQETSDWLLPKETVDWFATAVLDKAGTPS